MLQMVVRGDVEFRFVKERFTSSISEYPKTSALTRLQAKGTGNITTLRHGMLNVDALTRLIIQSIDGTRTHAQLVQKIADLAAEGKLNISVKGGAPADMNAIFKATVDKILEQLRKSALLES